MRVAAFSQIREQPIKDVWVVRSWENRAGAMPMRMAGLLSAVMALGLSAGEVVLISGSSLLRKGVLESTTLGSMQQREHAGDTQPAGFATLKDAAGKDSEVPCEVEVYSLGGDQGDSVVWRVEVPAGTLLQSLKVTRGKQLVAQIATPLGMPPPNMDFLDSIDGQEASLGWVLSRPKPFETSAIWVRLSWDEGRSWAGAGQLIHDESGTGLLNLERVPGGTSGSTLLEFWVPQGLQLTRLRHRIPGQFRLF